MANIKTRFKCFLHKVTDAQMFWDVVGEFEFYFDSS